MFKSLTPWKIRRFIAALSLALFMLLEPSCTRKVDYTGDPRARLNEYVARSFAVKTLEDKKILLSFMTGDVKERLAQWSDVQFTESFIRLQKELLNLSFREIKAVSPTEVQITYELSYLERSKGLESPGQNESNQAKNLHEVKVTHKKLCQMIYENGAWFIADVKNIKELLEFKNELSFP